MKVLLACMPFATVDMPSLGLGTLQAGLRETAIECDVVYPSLAFAQVLGRSAYERIAVGFDYWTFAGEWVFTGALYGPSRDPGRSYLEDDLARSGHFGEADIELLRRAREAATPFVERMLESEDWGAYDVIGFSSVNAQNIASLALARRIKERHPSALIVFGGANWQGEMGAELHRQFPFVDLAFSGEADQSFPAALESLSRHDTRGIERITGIVYRRSGRTMGTGDSPPVAQLDSLPIPDHHDFFEQLRRSSVEPGVPPSVPLETSRGCWWAQASCCRFCGLNSTGRVYRTKSPDRILTELRSLAGGYEGGRLCLVDNVVSPAFLRVVLPRLAADPLPIPLFLDVRPDVTREQVRLLGSIRASVQPGIESLNDHVLRLLGKGSDALENIRLLKWCRTFGVPAMWNMLYGFPGECSEDFEATLDLLPALRFLRPPEGCGPVRIDRFSPLFDDHVEYGIRELRPLSRYAYLYPFSESVLRRIAYCFSGSADLEGVPTGLVRRLSSEVRAWQREYGHEALHVSELADGSLRLLDRRPDASTREVKLAPLEQLIYRACEDIAERSDLHALAAERWPENGDMSECVDECLASLVQRRLMVAVGDRFLSLALPEETGWRYAVQSRGPALETGPSS